MSLKHGKGDRWYIQLYRDGKRYSIPFTGTEAEARAMEQDLRGGPSTDGRAKIVDLLPGYLHWYETNRSPNAATSVNSAFKNLLPSLGKVPVCLLGRSHYEQYKEHRLRDGAKRSSINLELKILTAFLNWNAKRGIIDKPKTLPDYFLKNQLKLEQRPIEVLSPEELARLFTTAQNGLKTLLMLLFWGGLRRSEACNLQWSQVHLEQSVMSIRGKGGEVRLQHIPEPLREYLEGIEKKKYVAVSSRGGRFINPMKQIVNLGKRAGITKHLHAHLLRHTHATALLLQGASLPEVQESLRHATMDMTRRYLHLAGALSSQSGTRLSLYLETHNEKAENP